MSLDRTKPSETFTASSSQEHSVSNPDSRASTPIQVHPGARPPPDSTFLTRLQVYSTRIPQSYVTPFCGAGAGVASGIITCPLDVIKTKLQAQGGFLRRNGKLVQAEALYKGMIGTGRTIWRDEGLRGLYKGLGPMLLGYLPTWAVYLTIYDRSRDYFYGQTENWWLARTYASLTAGACSTIATNPIWVIKTRLMSQSIRPSNDGFQAPWYYKNTLDAARKMYASEGIRAFYSGLTPALLGLSHVAIQFPLYEYFKLAFTGFMMGEHPDAGNPHWVGIGAATFLSKICASTATYPHEVLRTRLQTQQRITPAPSPEGISFRGSDQPYSGTPSVGASSDGMRNRPRYRGVIRTFQTILKEEGWRAFYAGIGTNLFRAVPSAMTTMLTYEYLRNIIHWGQHEGEMILAEAMENQHI
ncbi:mitochondrial folate transporter/carrier [Arthroderma uncinatum]|uniref:mitochondrial folate transporter/carrier n=1 Tax=Arthroderma uncinatum TaxID=74035 RepID=UPI00144AA2E5|nr:mitochondrial folate transporter/carrier [Arthroderma uncinatum]KAF3491925.1 mitochondrial folate transporter/carrier [Arthroderma uncinatum]